MTEPDDDDQVLTIIERLDFWRLPADADVEAMVAILVNTSIERRPCLSVGDRGPRPSTCFLTIGYDAGAQVLELEFDGARLHRYLGVPAEVYQALEAAPSKGRFYRTRIYGRYVGARFGQRAATGEAA